RRGQPRRRGPQPVVELRRRGADRRRGNPHAQGTAAAGPDGDHVVVAGGTDDRERRRVRAHAARQQQRVLPGQRGLLDRLVAAGEQRRTGRVHLGGGGV